MDPTLTDILTTLGSQSPLVAYMIWRDIRRDAADKERVATDVLLATSLTALRSTIEGWKR